MKKTFLVLLAALSLAFVGAGCNDVGSQKPGESASATPAPADATVTPQAETVTPGTPTPETPRSHAVIYVVNKNAKGDQDELTPQTVALADPQTPARDAVDALLQAPGSPLAPGTALRGITINDGLATLDFSQSPVNETGGEGGQGEALTALGRTLGQFPEIRQFQIKVKGQLVKSFGEFTTDGPINVTRPADVQQAHQTGGATP